METNTRKMQLSKLYAFHEWVCLSVYIRKSQLQSLKLYELFSATKIISLDNKDTNMNNLKVHTYISIDYYLIIWKNESITTIIIADKRAKLGAGRVSGVKR